MFITAKVLNHFNDFKKTEFFEPLPEDLLDYEKWLPAFCLFDSSVGAVMVLLRPKDTAAPEDIAEWQRNAQSLPALWWTSVLTQVMKALPRTSRIRRYNAITTSKETHILPSYLHLYEEDVATLHSSIASTGLADFTWFLYSCKFGQRKLLETGQSLGPGPFGLDDGYDLNTAMRVSLHLALNFSCIDNSSSLFWSFDETKRWMCGESPLYGIVMNFSYLVHFCSTARGLYLLFGLTELGNFTKDSTKVPALDAAFGNSHPRLTYCQC